MSYDHCFWKVRGPVELSDGEIYRRLGDGVFIDGLEELPLDDIIDALRDTFPELDQEGIGLDCPRPVGAFQVETTGQSVTFTCYGLPIEDMNRIIELMATFRCPLYDPQVDRRFELRE